MVQKFSVSRDDSIYEAWPDVALTPSGRLVCVFSECTHHNDRSYTRIVVCHSDDRGRTWTSAFSFSGYGTPTTRGRRGAIR
jgi:sialidase-1